MPTSPRDNSQIRFSLWLFAAFVIVGFATSLSAVSIGIQSSQSTTKRENLEVSRLAALQISAADVGRIIANRDISPSERQEIARKLEAIRARIDGAKGLFLAAPEEANRPDLTVAPGPDGARLVDAHLGPLSRSARTAFSAGVCTTDAEPHDSPTGPVYSSFAPLTDARGDVVGLLILDRDASKAVGIVNTLKNSLWWASGVVVFLAFLFTLAITRHLRGSAFATPWIRNLTTRAGFLRATLLEMTLMGLTTGVLVAGLFGFLAQSRVQTLLTESEDRSDVINQLRSTVEHLSLSANPAPTLVAQAARQARNLGVPRAADALSDAGVQNRFGLALRGLNQAIQREQLDRLDMQSEIDGRTGWLTITFCIGSLLALGSLLLVRAAASQQHELESAQMDSEKHQVAYRQVAENLPIGLYTFSGGLIRYANSAWEFQTQLQPGEERTDAFRRVLHLDDRDLVLEILNHAESSIEACVFTYRVVGAEGDVRQMETRAVPILDNQGQLEHLLGFVIDITEGFEALEELEDMNREVLAKNSQLLQALGDIESNFDAMVQSLVKAVEAKDPYTAGHSDRVMRYCVGIGRELGLEGAELRSLERGALIHDIGKIGIPDEILTKPDALTAEEFDIVKLHPVTGFNMIQGIPLFKECSPIVLWHHERLDGSGYPDGLYGDHLPLAVQICAVADCFDAMTSTRAYRKAMPAEKAIALLRKDAENSLLDSNIVETLARIVERDGSLWKHPDDLAA